MLGVVGTVLTMVRFEPTTPNTAQHEPTRWPKARDMLRPTMLRYVALACCDRLAGALGLTIEVKLRFQIYPAQCGRWLMC